MLAFIILNNRLMSGMYIFKAEITWKVHNIILSGKKAASELNIEYDYLYVKKRENTKMLMWKNWVAAKGDLFPSDFTDFLYWVMIMINKPENSPKCTKLLSLQWLFYTLIITSGTELGMHQHSCLHSNKTCTWDSLPGDYWLPTNQDSTPAPPVSRVPCRQWYCSWTLVNMEVGSLPVSSLLQLCHFLRNPEAPDADMEIGLTVTLSRVGGWSQHENVGLEDPSHHARLRWDTEPGVASADRYYLKHKCTRVSFNVTTPQA